MADALKKDIALKFLMPMVVAYVGGATAIGMCLPFSIETLPIHAAAAAGITGLIGLVLEEIYPRPLKEVLVFWRRTERVPGFQAFSQIGRKDTRVEQAKLSRLLPKGQMSPSAQNSLWYKWLKEVEDNPGIAQNHRTSLILRDATALAATLAVLTPILGLVAFQSLVPVIVLQVSCLGVYLALMFAARHAAERLVGNVIALKVAKTK